MRGRICGSQFGLGEGVAENGGADDGGESDEADDLVHKMVTP